MIRRGLSVIDACSIALDAHLYVNGWCMRSYLIRTVENLSYSKVTNAAVWFDHGFAVAISIITTDGDIQAFVKPEYRRKGIGTKLVEHLKEEVGKDAAKKLDAGRGIEGSERFWAATKIVRWDLSKDEVAAGSGDTIAV